MTDEVADGGSVTSVIDQAFTDQSPSRAEIRELSRRNTWRLTVAYAFDWGAIAGIYALAAAVNHPAGYLVAIFLLGTRQHALSVLGHEGTHGRAHPNRRVNKFMTDLLTFWPLGFDGAAYARFHLLHHRRTSQSDDPELAAKARQRPKYDLPLSRRRLVLMFVGDLVGGACIEVLNLYRIMRPLSMKEAAGPICWWSAALLLSWLNGALWIPAIWLAALFSSYWAVSRVRILAEHQGTMTTHRHSQTWWQRFLFFPNNIGYHYEHHLWPSIPYWNLPRVRRLDTRVPVVPVGVLLESYAHYPAVSSGVALACTESPRFELDARVGAKVSTS